MSNLIAFIEKHPDRYGGIDLSDEDTHRRVRDEWFQYRHRQAIGATEFPGMTTALGQAKALALGAAAVAAASGAGAGAGAPVTASRTQSVGDAKNLLAHVHGHIMAKFAEANGRRKPKSRENILRHLLTHSNLSSVQAEIGKLGHEAADKLRELMAPLAQKDPEQRMAMAQHGLDALKSHEQS